VPDFRWEKKATTLSLNPISVDIPFMQWGLDFIEEINPPSSMQHKWIVMATNYFMNWIESVPTKQAIDVVIIQFLKTNILSRFECHVKIIIDNATTFKSKGWRSYVGIIT
jgi:hypothetical protein